MLPEALKGSQHKYRPDTAKFLADCADIAYDAPEFAEASYIDMGATSVDFISVENHQAYVVFFGEVAVVAVRGTQANFQDILTDLKFRRKAVPGAPANASGHRGFVEASSVLYFAILKLIEDKQTFFTGHSLGGAMAVLCSSRYSIDWPHKVIVYTFGCPRIGGKKLASHLDGQMHHYRLVNGCDIVPNVPLLSMNYRHSGTLIYLSQTMEIWQNPPMPKQLWDMALDLVVGLREGFNFVFPTQIFRRHRMGDYCRFLFLTDKKKSKPNA